MPKQPVNGLTTAYELSDTLLWGTPYRPIHRLGHGGMGEVIEAEHKGLRKPVVVKLLRRDLESTPHLVERMRVEAQALARLDHPNLVMVTDFGQTADGRAYIAMERLYGRTLKEELAARGPLPVLEAIDYVVQALGGLSAAHKAGIVHRDVKLENIFVCDADEQGRRVVKVLDFGIAKILAQADTRAPAPPQYPTQQGVLVGTPRYLAPEQACGLPVDARTDVYAAGTVLYTLLTGRSPFEHIGAMSDLLRAHAFQVPDPPSRHAPTEISTRLDQVVMKALQKDPARRFCSAALFADDLQQIAGVLKASPQRSATEPMHHELSAVAAAISQGSSGRSSLSETVNMECLAAAPVLTTERFTGFPACRHSEPTMNDRPLRGSMSAMATGWRSGAFLALMVVSALLCGFVVAALLVQ